MTMQRLCWNRSFLRNGTKLDAPPPFHLVETGEDHQTHEALGLCQDIHVLLCALKTQNCV